MSKRLFRTGRQRGKDDVFPIVFNACAYAAFAYVAETADEEDIEATKEMMDLFFDSLLNSPDEINL